MSEIRTIEETLNLAIDKLFGMSGVQNIQQALTRFSGEQREFLALKFIQGLNNKEISKATGKSLGALKIMQFKVIKVLKTLNRVE